MKKATTTSHLLPHPHHLPPFSLFPLPPSSPPPTLDQQAEVSYSQDNLLCRIGLNRNSRNQKQKPKWQFTICPWTLELLKSIGNVERKNFSKVLCFCVKFSGKILQDNLLCRIEGQDQELAKGGEDEVIKMMLILLASHFGFHINNMAEMLVVVVNHWWCSFKW